MRDQLRTMILQARRSADGVGDRRSLNPDVLTTLAKETIRLAHVATVLHMAEVARRRSESQTEVAR